MGTLCSTKILPQNKIVCKIELDLQEAKALKNAINNVHCFCSEHCTTACSIIKRGKKGSTNYFEIPLSLRSRKQKKSQISYQKIETDTKVFYICMIEKIKILPQ